jgi:endoglucanase
MLTAVVLLLVFVAGITGLSLEGGRSPIAPIIHESTSALKQADADAKAFLTRYVAGDGRVVRRDQGSDTVSEGQGYAMLLAAAIGDEATFAKVWQWDAANLQEPSALFAYHWNNGKVVGTQPATDADLQTAWALLLGSQKFHDSAYRAAALKVASAVLAKETVTIAGQPQLVAGPWATSSPAVVDPSYLSTEAMGALGNATGNAEWSTLATDSTTLVQSVISGSGAHLPANWVDVDASGAVKPEGSASGTGAPAYGLDAQRVPIWFAAGCTAGEKAISASAWPTLSGAAGNGARLSYSLSGSATSTLVNPVGLVAAAAAARSAGHAATSARLLAQADAQSRRGHTYYGDAWVALGRILLDTNWLTPCAPMTKQASG